jgi:hypothetical protein
MQLNSLAMGFCVCVVLLLAHDSIPVAVDTLVVVHIPVEEEGNLAEEGIPVEEGNLAAADTLVVCILEEASVALQSRIEAAHADLHLFHVLLLVVVQWMVFLLVAVQVVVRLLVVRLAVPGCSYVSPPILTLASYLQESCDWHEVHRQ